MTLRWYFIRYTLVIWLMLGVTPSVACQSHPSKTEGFSGNLAEALSFVAVKFKLPLIAEIAEPVPQSVTITAGDYRSKELLDQIVLQVPGYRWKQEGPVVFFFHDRLVQAKANAFNMEFADYSLPSNVGMLQLTLPGHIRSLYLGKPLGQGFVVTGVTSAKGKLTPRHLKNVSPREVMLAAAREGGFYAIIVFPDLEPDTIEDLNSAISNWYWGEFTEPRRIFLQHRDRPR